MFKGLRHFLFIYPKPGTLLHVDLQQEDAGSLKSNR